ncbi:hypothetical protein BJY52DRAFT_1254002 [Lactarius psammicola]|nr:hypothetical protein BJY52DRAFT_1254002 [Lactarius psammicola]
MVVVRRPRVKVTCIWHLATALVLCSLGHSSLHPSGTPFALGRDLILCHASRRFMLALIPHARSEGLGFGLGDPDPPSRRTMEIVITMQQIENCCQLS